MNLTAPFGSPVRTLLRALLFLVFGAVPAISADRAAPVRFDVPAGEASTTLRQFSEQSGQTVVYLVDAVRGVRTGPVRGEFTPRDALNRLLAGTELVLVQDEKTGALSVNRLPAEAKNVPGRAADAGAAGPAGGRMADGTVRLDTFEVFGSKLINADLPRTRDDVQPYVVFGRDQIESANAANLDDFFRTRLPMNNLSSQLPENQSFPGPASQINLRGLGSNQTLILVDGRRAPLRPLGPAGVAPLQADINGIPLSMIERIEILPSTASGIYGGGATGGVINIITRKDFSGAEVALSYGNTFETDVARRRADLNASFSLNAGRTLLSLSASHSDGNLLLVQDRDFARRARALLFANNPTAITGASTPLGGYTTNIRSQNGSNLILKPQFGGTALGSPITFVPVGFAGVAVSGAAPLVENAGRYNLDLPDMATLGRRASLTSAPESKSLSLGARHRFTANVEAFVDASVQDNGAEVDFAFFGNTVTLPATAPNNPFTVPITVAWPATAISEDYSQTSKVRRASAGVIVRLPREWNAGLEYSWAKSSLDTSQPITVLGDPDGPGPLPSFNTAATTGGLDLLRDLNRFPLDYAPYRLPRTISDTRSILRTDEASMRASGPIWELPGGPLTLSSSLGWRKEAQPSAVRENIAQVPSTFSWFPAASLQARSAYVETRVPVLSEQRTGLLRALELQLSMRYDWQRAHTRALSGTLSLPGPDGPFPSVEFARSELSQFSETVGFRYAPTRQVILRASLGTGFLPPTLTQLTASGPGALPGITITDPKRGNVPANTGPVTTAGSGGGLHIRPEESESVSAGVVLTPRFLPGFRLSLDYTRIRKTDEIASLQFQQLFDFEDFIPGSVVRDPLTPQDQALGYTGGRVISLGTNLRNLAQREIVAYDLQADYELQSSALGQFRLYALVTHQKRFASRPVAAAPLIEAIGFVSGLPWRGNGGIDWKRGPWSANWNLQYYDSYFGYPATASAAARATFVLNQGSARIASRMFHDVSLGYQFLGRGEGWRRYFNDTRVLFGVQDVFNRGPAILASTSVSGDRSGYGDPRMARYTVTLRRLF